MKSKIFFLIIIIFGHYFVQSQNTDSLLIGRWLVIKSESGDEIEYYFKKNGEFYFFVNGHSLSTMANVTNGDTVEVNLNFKTVSDSNLNKEMIQVKDRKKDLFRLEIILLSSKELTVSYHDPLLKITRSETFQRINLQDSP